MLEQISASRRVSRRKAIKARLSRACMGSAAGGVHHFSIERLEGRVLLSGTVYVDAAAPGVVQDGMSWGSAYTNLQTALGVATVGETIEVAQGTYTPTSGTSRTATFQLIDGVSILGGFAGYGTADPDARDVAAYPTILSGLVASIVNASNTDATAVLDGFTITGGNGGNTSTGFGGGVGGGAGIFDSNGGATIVNCKVIGNTADFGGGMFNTDFASPTLVDCIFVGNSTDYGGGVYDTGGSSPQLTRCTFSANTATNGFGGAICSYNSSATLNECVIDGDSAREAGAIWDYYGSMSLVNCTIAGDSSTVGGAIVRYGSIDTISNSIIYGDGPDEIQNEFGGTGSVTYTDIQSGYPGIGNIDADPQFVDPSSNNYALQSTSPAINAGSNAAVFAAGVNTDLAGNARIINGTVDMGAYEFAGFYGPSFAGSDQNQAAFSVGTAGSVTILTNGFPAPQLTETGPLPAGVTFVDNGDGTATLAGTALAGSGGVYDLTITAGNGIGPDATFAFELTVSRYQAPAFVGANNAAFAENANGTFTIQTTGYPTPVLSESGDLPYNLIFTDNGDGTATISGTPTDGTHGSYQLTLTASNGVSPAVTETFTLKVASPPSIISDDHANFLMNRSNMFTISTSEFPAAAITETGALPAGITFTDNGDGTATFSGKPAAGAGGIYDLTVTVSNGIAPAATQLFTLNVVVPPSITSGNQATFTADRANTFTITTSGAPIPALTETATLPAGLTFTDNGDGTAMLSGVPAPGTEGIYDLTETAKNGFAPNGTQSLVLTIVAPIPQTIYVDANSPAAGAAQDGNSWATAFASLQSALAAAQYADTIDVAQGTYYPTTGADRTATFQLLSGVTIDGGFAGAENPTAARNVAAYTTILSGDIGVAGDNSDNSYHVVTGSGTDATAVLDGFTITGGNADGTSGYQDSGGGMLNVAGSPTVLNCIFNGNTTSGYLGTDDGGGGMGNFSSSSPTITDCTFSNDTAYERGGGLDFFKSSATITNCVFISNSALLANGYGGGIMLDQSTATITDGSFADNSANLGGGLFGGGTLSNCTFTGNTASNGGGADGGTLSNCTFTANVAQSSGGGVDAFGALIDCTFIGNVATSGGGAYGGGTVTGCTFLDNLATGGGGGLNSGAATVSNCIFTANSATSGGGMYADGGTVTNCIFTRNIATGDGGAIADNGAKLLTALDCTFDGNTAANFGGGISFESNSDQAALTNCAFVGNVVVGQPLPSMIGNNQNPIQNYYDYGYGGAVFGGGGSESMVNCTFADNSAPGGGAAVGAVYSKLTLVNCIAWGDTSEYGGETANPQPNYNATITVTYSDIQGGYAGAGNIMTDPQFVRSPSPGADGVWGTADDDYGNLQIQPYSPAVDAGNNAAVPAGVTTDLAGNSRFQDVPTSAHSGAGTVPIVDMGAYEAAPALAAGFGGPFTIAQGYQFPLSGLGSSTVAGPLTFSWDLNGDGVFGDATGPNVVFNAAEFAVGTQVPVSLRVTDAAGNSVVQTELVTIAPPVIYVDSSAAGADDGTSWANAFTTLTDALTTNVIGETVEVAEGTYYPTAGTDRTASFELKDNLDIEGGFAGVANPAAARNVLAYPTILSGDIGVSGVKTDNSYHVVTANGVDATAILDGFTVTLGYANGAAANQGNGSGMFVSSASPTVLNCTFSANNAAGDGSGNSGNGGAVYISTSSIEGPSFTDCVFVGNNGVNGGAISDDGDAAFTNCTFSGNLANNADGIDILNVPEPPLVTNCIFSDLYTDVFGDIGYPDEYASTVPISTITYCDVSFPGTGNIAVDPQFANPGAGNFALLPTSPCINMGSNAAIDATGVTTDIAGNPRIYDGIVDMGAYEAQSVTVTWIGKDAKYTPGENGNYAGNWNDPANWSDDRIPNAIEDVLITFVPDQFSSAKIIVSQGDYSLRSLTVNVFGILEIEATGELKLFAPATFDDSANLTIDPGGTLDLQNNSLTVDFYDSYSDPAKTFRSYLQSAYNHGLWTGTGLTSSTVAAQVAGAIASGGGVWSIGYADGDADMGQTIAGSNQLVIEPALVGDANLDGSVSVADLGRVAQNLGSVDRDWMHGDFNYDGRVNFLDVGLVAQNLDENSVNTPLSGKIAASQAALVGQTLTIGKPASVGAGPGTASTVSSAQKTPAKVVVAANQSAEDGDEVLVGTWTPAASGVLFAVGGDGDGVLAESAIPRASL